MFEIKSKLTPGNDISVSRTKNGIADLVLVVAKIVSPPDRSPHVRVCSTLPATECCTTQSNAMTANIFNANEDMVFFFVFTKMTG